MMTRNQIAFWELREKQRSNRRNEIETTRSNRAREVETHRSNLADEIERNRHNLATEGLTQQGLQNDLLKINNDYRLALSSQAETKRANLAKEQETNRSNLARELENRTSRLIANSFEKSRLARENYEARTKQYSAEETARANRARENQNYLNYAENKRHSLVQESETYRSNKTNESQRGQSILLDYAKLDEMRRSNLASEANTRRGQVLQLAGTLGSSAIRTNVSLLKGVR